MALCAELALRNLDAASTRELAMISWAVGFAISCIWKPLRPHMSLEEQKENEKKALHPQNRGISHEAFPSIHKPESVHREEWGLFGNVTTRLAQQLVHRTVTAFELTELANVLFCLSRFTSSGGRASAMMDMPIERRYNSSSDCTSTWKMGNTTQRLVIKACNLITQEVERVACGVSPREAVEIKISLLLRETNKELIQRAIDVLGPSRCSDYVAKTVEVELNGGILTAEGDRRRLPGGSFLHLIRNAVPAEQFERIRRPMRAKRKQEAIRHRPHYHQEKEITNENEDEKIVAAIINATRRGERSHLPLQKKLR